MRLSELGTGEKGVIVKVLGHGGFRKRIVEMGFIKGKTVEVLLNAPLKDPIKYKVLGYEISLRRQEAEMIEVVSEEEAKKQAEKAVYHEGLPEDVSVKEEDMKRLALGKRRTINVALVGNPNSGKTSLFNLASGAHEHVGNYSGVTVDAKEGYFDFEGYHFRIVDLPGTYSLSAYTPEEIYVRRHIVDETPDVIINVVDSSNLERNLYLTTQLLELGIPVVIALNMADLLEKNKISIDTKALEKELGCKVVKTSALKGTGIHEVVKEAVTAAKKESIVSGKIKFSKDTEAAVSEMEGQLPSSVLKEQKKWYAIKLLERDAKVLEQLKLTASVQNQVEKIAARLEEKLDDDTESIITNERYEAITHVVEKCVKKPKEKLSTSDKIDQIVTNRILGLPIFLGVMYVVYAIAVMTIGTYVTDWTNDVLVVAIQDAAASGLQAIGTAAFLEDLIVNGIIGGLGAVLGFLPQMAILFVLLSILEDCGYMVRVAFVMDRIFRKFGLSGKSFIPLLISSGCGIPGIMASKTIENDNDRRLTIMTSTFVPCGAKLPVIALMAGVIGSEATGFPAGALTFIMYVIGVAAVLVSAIILKKTKPFHGDAAPFVMELPAYHLPQAKTVLIHTWERLKGFIRKAGTILLLACIVMWFLGGYGFTDGSFGAVEDSADSILASIGSVIAVIFTPLGFGKWQPVAASLSGFSAKEAIVTTMGVLANVAGDTEDPAVVAHGVATWFPSAAAGFSFLLFNLLDSPCLAAIATMAKELNDRKWFWFAILFQNVFAYVVTFMVYQISGVATGALTFGASTVVAILLLAVVLYLLFRKDPYKGKAMSVKRSVSEA